MANDSRAINDIYNNGLNAAYGELPSSQNMLPKTGQTVSYDSGDDGEYEAGLSDDGSRFEIVNLSGDDVVIDHHTGLMWPKDFSQVDTNSSSRSWSNHLTAIAAMSFAGFGDWRMANALEAASIIDYSNNGQTGPDYGLYDVFILPSSSWYHTATTVARLTTYSYGYYTQDSKISPVSKGTLAYAFVCRRI